MTCLFTSIYTHNIIISGVSQLRRTAFDSEVLTRISVYGEVGEFPMRSQHEYNSYGRATLRTPLEGAPYYIIRSIKSTYT